MDGEVNETLESLFPEGQIRIAEISVFNWGTFTGLHTGVIDPNGTLVTGHTGAGKSTFVDALQVLLLQANQAHFNVAAAQQDKQDRSLLTYVRGKLGSVEDSNGRNTGKFKRKKEALSGIRALYRSDAGSEITLSALFWVGVDDHSVGDVNRGYVVAHRNISLKELLDTFRGENRNETSWAKVAARYKGDDSVSCSRTFTEYSVHFRRALWLDEEKAPALLSRAMGLKRISDLTELVRTLVLEEPDTRQKAIDAIAEFENLNAIHAELDEARRRKLILDKLPGHQESFVAAYTNRDFLKRQVNAQPIWFARQQVELLEKLINQAEETERVAAQVCADAKLSIKAADDAYDRAMIVYNAAGGDRLESLKRDLVHARTEESSAIENLRVLQSMMQRTGLVVPEDGWTEEALRNVRLDVEAKLRVIESQKVARKEALANALVAVMEQATELEKLQKELRQLQARPGSAIDVNYQQLREDISVDTGIPSAEMPFLGELIDIKESEALWRGAIERSLAFDRLRFIVDQKHRKAVTEAISRRHTGLRVGVEVGVANSGANTSFDPNSFLRKLEWAQHPFRDWLKRFLVDRTLECVDSVEAMQTKPYSMTITGLIQRKIGSFEKNDAHRIDDVSKWYTGFSNSARIERLESDITAGKSRLLELRSEEEAADKAKASSANLEQSGQSILKLEWSNVDVVSRHREARSIADAVHEMETTGVNLQKALEAVQACNAERTRTQGALEKAGREHERIKIELTAKRSQHEIQGMRVHGHIDERVIPVIEARVGRLTAETLPNADEIERNAMTQLNGLVESAFDEMKRAEHAAGLIMSAYKREFKGPASDLPERNPQTDEPTLMWMLDQWREHYEALVDGKLPGLVTRFQDSLTHQATQSLTAISQSIQMQASEITDRIEQINRVLKNTEFRAGTYLELVAVRLNLDAVRVLEEQMQTAIRNAASKGPDAHFEALKALINTLQRATDPSTRWNKDSLCQLDARYRMDFAARETRRADGSEVDFMRNTGGKSGGEKESFSGAIVAATLAYVLKPTGGVRPAYCSVFLDEAFANTSDEAAKRVLKVFKELGLHVNLITPFKNVELARTAVNSAIVVEIDADNNSSLYEVTWEEIDQQRRSYEEGLIAVAKAESIDIQVLDEAT